MVNTILYLIFYHAINLSKKKDKTNYLRIFFPKFLNSVYEFYITSIAEAGTHPTLPSSKRISFHSFIELSLILTLRPS